MTAVPARSRPTARQIAQLVRAREEKRGLLIAFEGPDGSGKTTQRRLFKNWLATEGHNVVTTKWNSSEFVKPLVRARKAARSLSPEEFSMLHAADFRYRLDTEILPALWQGRTVIADRYLFTGLARDAARGLDFGWLLDVYWPMYWPDLVFYFSVSPQTSGQRIAKERSPSYYESGQDMTGVEDSLQSYTSFIGRVIQEYEALAKIFQFVTVDAEQSIADQHKLIRSLFAENGRRPMNQPNREVLATWLRNHPKAALL